MAETMTVDHLTEADRLAQGLMMLFGEYPLPLNDEKVLQERIAQILEAHEVDHQREVRLNGHNIIDFMVGEVGIEVKLRESKMKIFDQLERYARFDRIGSLLLMTNTPMGLPGEIKGKPVYYLPLGRAWL